MEVLLNDYYENVNYFHLLYDSVSVSLSDLNSWLKLTKVSITGDNIILNPTEDYIMEFDTAKKKIGRLVLDINFKYDVLRGHLTKIGDSYCLITQIEPDFEGEEYDRCLKRLNRIRSINPTPLGKIVFQ